MKLEDNTQETNISALCEAAKQGKLETVKFFIEKEKLNPNLPNPNHPVERAIDCAAKGGHLEIVKYLYGHGAQLSSDNSIPNFLSWAAFCKNVNNRKQVLDWLLENNRYEKLNCAITPAHIYAALGDLQKLKNCKDTHSADSTHLRPYHYSTLSNNNDCFEFLTQVPSDDLFQPIPDGIYQGITLVWWLTERKKTDLLKGLLQHNHNNIDLNTAPSHENHPDKGSTLALLLARLEKFDLLQELLERNPNTTINLNTKPTPKNHPGKGITLAWWLALQKQYDLLQQILNRNPHATVDLNATPKYGINKNVTLAWWLVFDKKFALLNHLLTPHSKIKIDLKVKAESASYKKNIFELFNSAKLFHIIFVIPPILFKILHVYEDEEIYNLINKYKDNNEYNNCIGYLKFYLAKRFMESYLINEESNLDDELKRKINQTVELFKCIKTRSSYYQKAQLWLADLIRIIQANEKFVRWAIENPFQENFDALELSLYYQENLSDNNKLELVCHNFLLKNGQSSLTTKQLAASLRENTKLKLEIAQLRQTQQVDNGNTTTNTDDAVNEETNAEPIKKRRKIEAAITLASDSPLNTGLKRLRTKAKKKSTSNNKKPELC